MLFHSDHAQLQLKELRNTYNKHTGVDNVEKR